MHGIFMPSIMSDGSKDDVPPDLGEEYWSALRHSAHRTAVRLFQKQLDLGRCGREPAGAYSRIVMAYSNSKGLCCRHGQQVGACLRLFHDLRRCGRRIRSDQDPAQDPCVRLPLAQQGCRQGMGIGGLHIVGNEQGLRNAVAGRRMIPVNSIEKAPSAELRPRAERPDSLPEYELLDPGVGTCTLNMRMVARIFCRRLRDHRRHGHATGQSRRSGSDVSTRLVRSDALAFGRDLPPADHQRVPRIKQRRTIVSLHASGGVIWKSNGISNTVTEQPELGMISPAEPPPGPYKTAEDALDAWKIDRKRNIKWEEQDREWKRYSSDEK